MQPLSCINCCHNPLQLGAIGPAFGYCTRHRVVLSQPHQTTCGQLLRKDLLGDAASAQRTIHLRTFRPDRVSVSSAPAADATKLKMTERPNGQAQGDVVIDEVRSYGDLDSKIGTMAVLRRISGPRAEIAMLSLSRAYVSNCYAKGGRWTAGLHLAFWTMQRLADEPQFGATEIRGPFANRIETATAIASWTLIMFRLALLADVGNRAHSQRDRSMGGVQDLVLRALDVAPDNPARLLGQLRKDRRAWAAVLPMEKYERLKAELHRDSDSTENEAG